MSVETIKATRVVRTALGVLERQLVLPRLVWRDAGGDFRGAEGDTITIRVPAYSKAKKRTLRAVQTKDASNLVQRAVAVTLTDNLYNRVPITSEELTLDIERFEEDIVEPVVSGIARSIEDEVVAEMQGANYENTATVNEDNPWDSIVDARRYLNDSNVPMSGRALVVGSELEAVLLKADQFVKVNEAGSDSALREAQIGRLAGMPVYTVPALDPDEGYAFHQTAFVLGLQAPFVPAGVAWGQVDTWEGFAIRVARAVAEETLVEHFHADVYVGTNHVIDEGTIDENGRFEPADAPSDSTTDDHFVRAVKLQLASSA